MKSRTKKSIAPARLAEDVRVQLSLPVAGVLQDVHSAFFGLCIDAGKAVLGAMMEAERAALCGPKGCPDASRSAYRGGHTRSQIVLGGRRIAIARPRARAVAAGELKLPTFAWAAQADPLQRATIAAIAAGVSTRRYERTLDPLPPKEVQSAVSKSAVSRRFVALSSVQLTEWLSRRIDAIDLPVVMIDGIHFRDRVVLVAFGFDSQGKKHVLGIREGSTEKTAVVKALLSELIDRGLDADRMRLWVIDGAKALRRAIADVFGASALVQRCQVHKRRNVLEHLPDEMHASVGRAMADAWGSNNVALAKRQLERLASSLAKDHPGAANSLREGLDETLTVIDLGLDAALYRTFATTNPIENLNGSIAQFTANVKRWRDGQMVLRWIGAALTDASKRFRAVRGFRDMKRLLSALAKRAQGVTPIDRKAA
jgi:transposase-like protein